MYRVLVVYSHMKKNTIIFDLDGTLALIDKRRDLSRKPNGKIDFKILHDPSNIHLDKPNPPVVKMAQMFAQDGFKNFLRLYRAKGGGYQNHSLSSFYTRLAPL